MSWNLHAPGRTLFAIVFVTTCPHLCQAETVEYELRVRNDWSQDHHKPGAPPFTSVEQPHFSHLGGGTHNADLVVWQEGQLSSSGMIKMQETGYIDEPFGRRDLAHEFDAHIANGIAGSFLNYPIPNPWFPAGTETTLNFTIDDAFPLVTLVSMLGPSPDWFVGVSGLSLRDDQGWRQLVEVDLYPYDGGSRSRDGEFALFGPLESPQLPIQAITDTDDTLLLGSIPIGSFTFELLTPQPPAGDYTGDGTVDGADAQLWAGTFGQNIGPGAGADGDANGMIAGGDLLVWQLAVDTPELAASVPEPSRLALLACAWLAAVGRGRTR